MARVLITGFEASPPTATDINSPDGYVFAGTAGTLNTTTKKSGGSSLQLVAGATTAFANIPRSVATNSVSVAFWFRRTGTNSGTAPEVGVYGTALQARVAISSTGTVTAYGGATGTTSTSSAIPVDTWAHIELRANVTSTTGGTIRLFVDTVEIGSATAATWTAQTGTVFSLRMSAYATTGTVLYDDLVVDSLVSTTAPAIGASQLILVKPTSDVSIGGWLGGVGGTTNLFDAVNNFPPIGTGAETNLTQIENSTNGGGGAYVGVSETFSSQGAVGNIKSVRLIVCHGEDVATGIKTGYVRAEVTAASIETATFDYGGPVSGALGVYPSAWYWSHICAPLSFSSTSAVNLVAFKTDTGTRTASISALGAYGEYNPLSEGTGVSNAGATVDGRGPSQYVQYVSSSMAGGAATVTLNSVTVGNLLIATGQSVGIYTGFPVSPTLPVGWSGSSIYSEDLVVETEATAFIAAKIATSTTETVTWGGETASYTTHLAVAEIDRPFTGSLVILDSRVAGQSNHDPQTNTVAETGAVASSITPHIFVSGTWAVSTTTHPTTAETRPIISPYELGIEKNSETTSYPFAAVRAVTLGGVA